MARRIPLDPEVERRRAELHEDKLSSLLDYYAKTDVPALRVAEHLGFWRKEQVGTNDKGKPVFGKVPDVARAERELAWRKASAA